MRSSNYRTWHYPTVRVREDQFGNQEFAPVVVEVNERRLHQHTTETRYRYVQYARGKNGWINEYAFSGRVSEYWYKTSKKAHKVAARAIRKQQIPSRWKELK